MNPKKKPSYIKFAALASVLFSVSVFAPMTRDIYTLSFSILILMNIMITAGWNVIGGFTGYSSFGHVVFFGIGAYTTATVIRHFQLNFLVAIAVGILTAAILALPLGYPSLRLRGIYFALATSTLNHMGSLLVILLPFTGGPEGILLPKALPYDPLTNELLFYGLFLIGALGVVFLTYRIKHSKIGFSFLSIREDEDAAQACGVSTSRMKILAYALSSIPVSAAGGLYAVYTGYIDPTTMFSFSISMYAIALTYMGGKGTILGPIIGSVIYVFFAEYLRYSISLKFEGLHVVILMALLILMVVFMPEGIVGFLRKKSPLLRKFLF
jgi:branched-chain amino acid transport system permease protein